METSEDGNPAKLQALRMAFRCVVRAAFKQSFHIFSPVSYDFYILFMTFLLFRTCFGGFLMLRVRPEAAMQARMRAMAGEEEEEETEEKVLANKRSKRRTE